MTVQSIAVPASLEISPNSFDYTNGKRETVECTAAGDPSPSRVTWSRNGEPVPFSRIEQVYQVQSTGSSRLVFIMVSCDGSIVTLILRTVATEKHCDNANLNNFLHSVENSEKELKPTIRK